MWANLLPADTAALGKRFTSALEQTGDAITKRAQAHMKQNSSSNSSTKDENGAPSQQTNDTDTSSDMPTSFNSTSANSTTTTASKATATNSTQEPEMLTHLKSGWGSVVEATKQAVETTRVVVEKEQTRLQAHFAAKNGRPYTRDASLPLDTDALRDAEVVYVTDRIISMGHPAMQSAVDGDITSDRKLAAIGHLLRKRHEGKYMVWNLSELDYEYDILEDQVMVWNFPGSPAPPLGKLIKILISIESWLKADPKNVAVVHCLTGKGRTSTVLATLLCWTGEAGFVDPNIALEYIADCKRMDVQALTIPSQRRYLSYFSNMLDGVRPSQPPLLLKRVIMNEAPKFGRSPDSSGKSTESQLGCAPYLQIFKSGKLVFTAAASKSYNQKSDDLPFCLPSDGAITFPIETIVQGDILVRCRHLSRKGQRVSMFRAAFHTGYVPPKVLRLTKAQLDGSCDDDRYVDGFFIDLIFEECDAKMAAAHLHLLPGPEDEESGSQKKRSDASQPDNLHNEAAARRMMGTVAGGSESEEGTLYDSMLHRDSRFWDLIANRREENRSKIVASTSSDDSEEESPSNEEPRNLYGPTIGRRREFAHEKKQGDNLSKGTEGSSDSKQNSDARSVIETFSIGGGLDFMEEEEQSSLPETKVPTEKKKDDLMDALNAIDDDLDGDQDVDEANDTAVDDESASNMSEEINFESDDCASTTHKSDTSSVPETNANDIATTECNEEDISKSSHDDSDLVNVSSAAESVNIGSSGDFEFDDDDDDDDEEDLADLENFLKKKA